MARLQFITTGNMTIQAEGLSFGKHIREPKANVKSYIVNPSEIILNAKDMDKFTDWGIIELNDLNPWTGYLTVTIDSESLGWYGTAQVAIEVNGQIILSDNFQSGVHGPVGDPRRSKKYAVGNIG